MRVGVGNSGWSVAIDRVGTLTLGDRKLDIVRLDSERGRALFNDYYDAYTKSFPDENEQMTPEDILEASAEDHYEALMFVDGDEVIAGVQTSFFETVYGSFGVNEFRFVVPDERRSGLGRALGEAAFERCSAGRKDFIGMVEEYNDPRMMTEEEIALDRQSMDPYERLQHHKAKAPETDAIPALAYRAIVTARSRTPRPTRRRRRSATPTRRPGRSS